MFTTTLLVALSCAAPPQYPTRATVPAQFPVRYVAPPQYPTITPRAKTCSCSSQCTCGCNEGQPCRCATYQLPALPLTAPQYAAPIFAPSVSFPAALPVQSYAAPAPLAVPLQFSGGGGGRSGGC